MANKKRKRHPQRPQPAEGARSDRPAPPHGANAERRERKQQAREARERARKQAARRAATRRAAVFLGVGVLALAGVWALNRAASPGSLTDEVSALAQRLGCTPVDTPADEAPGGLHLDPGASANYADRPATSGEHDPSTLGTDTKVFEEPVREEQAVHSMEHGGVVLYYRNDGSVPQETIDGLAGIAQAERPVFVAPHANLEDGDGLAYAAWNTLMTCPGEVPSADAVTIANGFVDAFSCTSRAPEAGVSDELC
jgi:Protein of unknown function (DUF3105)